MKNRILAFSKWEVEYIVVEQLRYRIKKNENKSKIEKCFRIFESWEANINLKIHWQLINNGEEASTPNGVGNSF
jgi:hypothetical protein